MPNQIFPLNVDPESPLRPVKKKKPTFKQWFNERKRMLGIVLGVCLVTVGVIVYPYLNLQLFKGQIIESTPNNELVSDVVLTTQGDIFNLKFNVNSDVCLDYTPEAKITRSSGNLFIKAVQRKSETTTRCGYETPGKMGYEVSGPKGVSDSIYISMRNNLTNENIQVWDGNLQNSKSTDLANILIPNEQSSYYVGDKITKITWQENRTLCKYITDNDYNREVILSYGDGDPTRYTFPGIKSCGAEDYDGERGIEATPNFELTKAGEISISVGYTESDTQEFISTSESSKKITVLDYTEIPVESDSTNVTNVTPVFVETNVPTVENVKLITPKQIKVDSEIELYWKENGYGCKTFQTTDRILRLVDSEGKVYDETTVVTDPSVCKDVSSGKLNIKNVSLIYYIQVGEMINDEFVEYWNTSKNKIFSLPENPLTGDELKEIIEPEVTIPDEPTFFDPTLAITDLTLTASINNKGGITITTNKPALSSVQLIKDYANVIPEKENIRTEANIPLNVDEDLELLPKGNYRIVIDTVGINSDRTTTGETVSKTLEFEALTGPVVTPLLITTEIDYTNGGIYINTNKLALNTIEVLDKDNVVKGKASGLKTGESQYFINIRLLSLPPGKYVVKIDSEGVKEDWTTKTGETDSESVSYEISSTTKLTTSAKVNNKGGITITTNKTANSLINVLDAENKIITSKKDLKTEASVPSDVDLSLDTLLTGKYTVNISSNGVLTDGTNSGEVTTTSLSFETTTPTSTSTLTASPSTSTTGTAVTFTLVAGKSGECTINFGDNATSEKLSCTSGASVTATHTYTIAGTYTVKALIGVEEVKTLQYVVTAQVNTPSLAISPSPKSPEINDGDDDVSVKFTLTATNLRGPYSYKIEYDDGDTDYIDNQTAATYTFTHKYDEDDDYTVKASVTTKAEGTISATYGLEVTLEGANDEDDEDKETNCTNEKDDDDDGDTDYEDSDCKIPASKEIVISEARITLSQFDPNVRTPQITYKLNRDAIVTVEILNTSGKTVATLIDGKKQTAKSSSGTILTQSVRFYGTVTNTETGQKLPDGTYTYKITAANPSYETITDSKQGSVLISTGSAVAEDWEQGGTSGATTSTSTTSGSTKTTPLSTSTSGSANIAALTMQNAPPTSTAGTGPETLIYLIFPAISAFALTRKK